MKKHLPNLEMKQLIVHEVPRPTAGSKAEPILSEVPSPLPTEARTFFEEKTTETLGSKAFDVEFDPGTQSSIPQLVTATLGRKHGFVKMSCQAAVALASSHTGATSGGLLTVAECAIGTWPGLLLLKLEKEEGVRVERVGGVGRRTLSVEHIRTLMLTSKTRVFKVGLFVRKGAKNGDILGLVCDPQQPRTSETGVAQFFLETFLGCRLTQQPDVVTRDFFHAFEGFLSASVADPEVQTRYRMAVTSELASQDQTVDPKTFARKHLAIEHRKLLMGALELLGVPTSLFPKDTKLVKARLEKLRLDFQHGIHVIATREAAKERMKFKTLSNEQLEVTIRDKVIRTR